QHGFDDAVELRLPADYSAVRLHERPFRRGGVVRRGAASPHLNVAVVLPAYNEEGNLTPLITAVVALSAHQLFSLRVIVVDDGSTDGTGEELVALQRAVAVLDVVQHPSNRGFARALKTGIAEACRQQC